MANFSYFLGGAVITVCVSLAAWLLGMPFSLLIAIVRVRQISLLAIGLAVYVSFIRSLPLPLLIMLFYFGLPAAGIDLNPFVAGTIGMACNTSAFNSEIWRAAILGFSRDQVEAARACGMTPNQTFWRIILPQAWRQSLPNFTNEATLLVKASPAVSIIGIDDLTRRAGKIAASNYEAMPTICTGMMLYVLMLLVISFTSHLISRHFHQKYQLV